MTEPQPYTTAELPEAIVRLSDAAEVEDEAGEGGFDGAIADLGRVAATLRDYQRVLAENERLRHSAEILNDEVLLGIDKVATIALLQEYGAALNAGKPYPGTRGGLLLNAADMMVNLAQHLRRERAEVAALRVAVEMGERELQAVFLALNPECPAHPGQPNTCDNGVCDCFGDVNMGQQVATLRADKERLDWLEQGGVVKVYFSDGLEVSPRGQTLRSVIDLLLQSDAARSGGEGTA